MRGRKGGIRTKAGREGERNGGSEGKKKGMRKKGRTKEILYILEKKTISVKSLLFLFLFL